MDYEVILTYPAKAQFDHVINYILCEFESEQAALSVLNDAEDTKSRLAHVAGSLKLCDDPNYVPWDTGRFILSTISILCCTE